MMAIKEKNIKHDILIILGFINQKHILYYVSPFQRNSAFEKSLHAIIVNFRTKIGYVFRCCAVWNLYIYKAYLKLEWVIDLVS